MDGLIIVVVATAAISVPLAVTAKLRRTPLFWLPGALLLAAGAIAFWAMPSSGYGSHDDMAGGWDRIPYLLAGAYACGYGALCLLGAAIAFMLNKRRLRAAWREAADRDAAPDVELPTAIVANSASKF